jgi:protein-L-isoaspartate(D-aspartate) O-methyltransferase
MDIETARFNMIEQQIRPWDVLDQNVLDLLFKIKREDFVPEKWRTMAFVDMDIPLGQGQHMWAPKLEARCVQELQLRPVDRVLEIGTGSGYLTALLAHQTAHVHSVEIIPEFKMRAERALQQAGLGNTSLEIGDGACGWDRHGPYDVIVLGGSTPVLAESFARSLTIGGRLFAVVGEAPVMHARLITRITQDAFRQTTLFETVVPPLRHAPQPARFEF